MNKSYIECKNTEEICELFGIDENLAKIITLKTTAIAKLDKVRKKMDMNHTEFSNFLEIPKSRWSSIVSHPEKVTVDYLLNLLNKCGVNFKLKVA